MGLLARDTCALLEPFQCGDRLYTSESDVCRRHILTYKDGQILTSEVSLRTERIKIFLMVVDTEHRYSNEAERTAAN